MSLEKPSARSKRPSIEIEEERAWVSFYKRVGHDLALATEVLAQLDSDPDMKRAHLALYLCCKESQHIQKVRQARNKRIGQSIRWLCSGLLSLFALLFVRWPGAWHRSLRQGGDIVAECLPGNNMYAGNEPAAAKAGQLSQEPVLAAARVDFLQQKVVAPADAPASIAEAEASLPSPATRKAA